MSKSAKVIKLDAVRWLRAAQASLPQGESPRAACRREQADDLARFQAFIDQHRQRKPDDSR